MKIMNVAGCRQFCKRSFIIEYVEKLLSLSFLVICALRYLSVVSSMEAGYSVVGENDGPLHHF